MLLQRPRPLGRALAQGSLKPQPCARPLTSSSPIQRSGPVPSLACASCPFPPPPRHPPSPAPRPAVARTHAHAPCPAPRPLAARAHAPAPGRGPGLHVAALSAVGDAGEVSAEGPGFDLLGLGKKTKRASKKPAAAKGAGAAAEDGAGTPKKKRASKKAAAAKGLADAEAPKRESASAAAEEPRAAAEEPRAAALARGAGNSTDDAAAAFGIVSDAALREQRLQHARKLFEHLNLGADGLRHGGTGAAGAAADGAPDEAPLILSPEQRHAVDLVVGDRRNVFLTGCAGTGKSAVLRVILRELRERYGETFSSRVAKCATTGLAATGISGTTLNSALQIGMLQSHGAFNNMLFKEETRELIRALEVLIIDEASMLSAELLQALDYYLTEVRGCDEPFGGLQVVLAGDVFQLPPIEDKPEQLPGPAADSRSGGHHHHQQGHAHTQAGAGHKLRPDEKPLYKRGFFFQSPVFKYSRFDTVELTQVYRQEDEEFVRHLNAIRCGEQRAAWAALYALLAACGRPLPESSATDAFGRTHTLRPTALFATNKKVDDCNKDELELLDGEPVRTSAEDGTYVTAEPPLAAYQELVEAGELPPELLKALEAPYHRLLSNRQMGHVVRGIQVQQLLGAQERGRELLAVRERWLEDASKRLAKLAGSLGGLFVECQAAMEVDIKVDAQVMLLKNVDIGKGLTNGTRGVVLRFEALDEVEELQCVRRAAALSPEAGTLMSSFLARLSRVPVIGVQGARGGTLFEYKVTPAVFTATIPGLGECVRVQVPLKLAWAITVHKSQGMTLDLLDVHLNDFFAPGQVYTALSRARSMEGLQVTGKARDRDLKPEPRAMEWNTARVAGVPYANTQRQPLLYPWVWEDYGHHPELCIGNNLPAVDWFARVAEADELTRLRREVAELRALLDALAPQRER